MKLLKNLKAGIVVAVAVLAAPIALLKNLKAGIVVAVAVLAAPIASAGWSVSSCTEIGWRGLTPIAYSTCIKSVTCEDEEPVASNPSSGLGVADMVSGGTYQVCTVCRENCWSFGILMTVQTCTESCKEEVARASNGYYG